VGLIIKIKKIGDTRAHTVKGLMWMII